MNSIMFRLDLRDVFKGLISAVLGAVIVAIVGVLNSIFTAPNLDVFLVDWAGLGHNIVNVGVNAAAVAFWGYLAKNFLSNADGKFLGKI